MGHCNRRAIERPRSKASSGGQIRHYSENTRIPDPIGKTGPHFWMNFDPHIQNGDIDITLQIIIHRQDDAGLWY